jgi:(E)-4-hydroxy-3-methylbut-2-enyl-diphosphate synthase
MQDHAHKDHTSVRPWRAIQRRPSRKIRVGSVEVGGDAPITVELVEAKAAEIAAQTVPQAAE